MSKAEDNRALWEELGLDAELHESILAGVERNFSERVRSQAQRPAGMAYFDGVIHEAHSGRVRELVEHRERGGKFIGTFCIFVPEEIILALGAASVALCGGTAQSIPYAERTFPRDICPLLKSTLGLAFSRTCPYAPIKDLAIGETTCDAKKKTWDLLARKTPLHVMEVPQKKLPRDRELWREEVRELAERLEELTGNRLTRENFREGIALMNRKRRALQRLAELRKLPRPPISGTDALVVMQAALNDDPERFCGQLEAFIEELEQRVERGEGVAVAVAKRIMVSGCPSVMGNWKLHHLVEAAGAVIVCDETCTGARYYEHLVEEEAGEVEDMLTAIADRYLEIDCACFSPNEERLEHVRRLAEEWRVDGVVQYVLQYCHGYNLEAIGVAAALKKAGVPSVKIVTDYSEEDTGQLRTRLEAFLEML